MKRIIVLFVTFCFYALFACSSTTVTTKSDVTPITYKGIDGNLERSVGKLRRLAILPLQVKVSPEDQRLCIDPCDWDLLLKNIAKDSYDYLQEKRGYEVISLDPRVSPPDIEGISSDQSEKIAKVIIQHAASLTEEANSQPEIETLIRDFGKRLKVDGIVVIKGSATDLTLIDGASWYLTFALSIPISMARIGLRLEARIYETTTGKFVWGCKIYRGGSPFASSFSGSDLFGTIEPAVPEVMTLPADHH